MKAFAKEFCLRGLVTMGFGPVVLAIIYAILGATGVVETLTVTEVVRGVLSIALMAFIAAGITGIYQVEQLPLLSAILIHGGVLYLDYLLLYLFNEWIQKDLMAIGIFTGIFVVGYGLIWLGVYLLSKRGTDRLNQKLQAK